MAGPRPAPSAWLPLCWGLLSAGGGAEQEPDPCRCLKWREVYASKRAICGEAFELIRIFRPSLYIPPRDIEEARKHPQILEYAVRKCEDWLHLFDSNECINIDVDHYSGFYRLDDLHDQTFCYVSDECKNLNGGRPLGNGTDAEERRNVSVKICKRGEDQLLRDLDPLELTDHFKKLHAATPRSRLTFDLMVGEVYRASAPELHWQVIGPLWWHQQFKLLPPKLQACMLRNEAIMVPKGPDDLRNFKLLYGYRLIHADLDVREVQVFGPMNKGKTVCLGTGQHCVHFDTREF